MLALVAQPFRGVVASPSARRRLLGGLLELSTLAAILTSLAAAVVRIH
jgi:hypothetical protein